MCHKSYLINIFLVTVAFVTLFNKFERQKIWYKKMVIFYIISDLTAERNKKCYLRLFSHESVETETKTISNNI